jgi:hypothetical protein
MFTARRTSLTIEYGIGLPVPTAQIFETLFGNSAFSQMRVYSKSGVNWLSIGLDFFGADFSPKFPQISVPNPKFLSLLWKSCFLYLIFWEPK